MRNQKGITQYQLAESVGIDPKHMSHIETGRSFPKADLIEKFANALDIEYPLLFKTEHLQDRNYLLQKINKYLENSSDDKIRIIFKFIENLIN